MGRTSRVVSPLGVEHRALAAYGVTIGIHGLMDLVREAADDPGFDHTHWAPIHADDLERLARRIREGYGGCTGST